MNIEGRRPERRESIYENQEQDKHTTVPHLNLLLRILSHPGLARYYRPTSPRPWKPLQSSHETTKVNLEMQEDRRKSVSVTS